MVEVETWSNVLDISVECHLGCVAQQWDVDFGMTIHIKLTDVFTSHHKLSIEIVMDGRSLRTDNLSSDQHVVLFVVLLADNARCVGV